MCDRNSGAGWAAALSRANLMNGKYLSQQLAVFNILWAAGHLAHLLRKGEHTQPASWAVLTCCVLVCAAPRSRARMVALAVSQLWMLFANMPFADNHMYLMGFVNAGFVAAFVAALLHRDGGTGGGENVTKFATTAASWARLTLLVAYGAAAVAKLNRGFFDATNSCAVVMFYDAVRAFGVRRPFFPGWIEALMPCVIAATELLIPPLLLFRSSRVAGVVIAVVFHLCMSLSPTSTAIDFTLVLFALLFLFLPTTTVTAAVDRLRAVWGPSSGPACPRRTAVRVATTVFSFGVL